MLQKNPLAPSWLSPPENANALAETVWPASATRDTDGALLIGGVSAKELQQKYGTPLYVLDENVARTRATQIRESFALAFAEIGVPVSVYYAGKAFLCTEVARWMIEAGLRIDVCTGGELSLALAAGVNPTLLAFHGNNKSLAEIERAVLVGLGVIVIDSFQEIDQIAESALRHGRTQKVRLRINSGVHATTHEYLATAREDQKFGIPLIDAPEAVRAIRSHKSLRFLGLHSHIGSQIFAADGFLEAIRRLIRLQAKLLPDGEIPELNLGGGFGIAQTSADQVPQFSVIAQQMAKTLAAECTAVNIPIPKIAIEPGRSIIGPAGVTLYQIGTCKDVTVAENAQRRYLSVDGGMSDNPRPALYGADYTARIANRITPAPAVLSRVVGSHCESGDIVVRDEYLPGDAQTGDLLAVPATGAYCFSLSSNYNYLPRPAVIAIKDGTSRVLIRRETETELFSRDIGYHQKQAEHTP